MYVLIFKHTASIALNLISLQDLNVIYYLLMIPFRYTPFKLTSQTESNSFVYVQIIIIHSVQQPDISKPLGMHTKKPFEQLAKWFTWNVLQFPASACK